MRYAYRHSLTQPVPFYSFVISALALPANHRTSIYIFFILVFSKSAVFGYSTESFNGRLKKWEWKFGKYGCSQCAKSVAFCTAWSELKKKGKWNRYIRVYEWKILISSTQVIMMMRLCSWWWYFKLYISNNWWAIHNWESWTSKIDLQDINSKITQKPYWIRVELAGVIHFQAVFETTELVCMFVFESNNESNACHSAPFRVVLCREM